ncbi:MAG: hypothetical protein IJ325_11235 [Clostridia bacterium]|nr:hypothetical protein [Clostridia bacterium]
MDNVIRNPTVEGYFRDLGLSPLCCRDDVGEIPVFFDLLAERGEGRA